MRKLGRSVSMLLCGIGLIIGLVGCGTTNNENSDVQQEPQQQEEVVVAIETTPIATIVVKGFGTITAELYPEMAPNTVNNFIELANSGFYDGLTFHRIIEGFMIQGGDPDGTGTGGPGYSIIGEFESNGYPQNTLSHTKGTLSMARSNSADSAGSQFFIMSEDGTYLDGQYAGFGSVIDGIDVVEKIEAVATDDQDKPLEDVIIETIKVDVNGAEVPEVVKQVK